MLIVFTKMYIVPCMPFVPFNTLYSTIWMSLTNNIKWKKPGQVVYTCTISEIKNKAGKNGLLKAGIAATFPNGKERGFSKCWWYSGFDLCAGYMCIFSLSKLINRMYAFLHTYTSDKIFKWEVAQAESLLSSEWWANSKDYFQLLAFLDLGLWDTIGA